MIDSPRSREGTLGGEEFSIGRVKLLARIAVGQLLQYDS